MPSHVLLQPYKPTAEDPFDAVKAAHLLNRAGMGGTTDEIAKVQAMGPAKAVEWLLDFPDQTAEQDGKDLPDLSSIGGVPKDVQELRKNFAGKSEIERKELRKKLMMDNREAIRLTIGWWLSRMAFGKYPLQEKLTLFWHGHFVTSDKDERSATLMWNQNELLRKNVVGNFRTFVKAISRDPAMLDYLNNTQNRKAHPNENYARELMELFTLGIGNYTERDVKEGARALTGLAHDGDDFIYRKFDHDDGIKTFLGRTGNFDCDDVIDIILSQHVAAKFVGTKLFRFFAYEEPDDYLSEAIGNEFRQGNYEIRPLVKMILTSRAFYSPLAIGAQIKSPIQLVMGTIRQMGLPMPPTPLLLASLNQMGQVPFAPPNVRGWPGGRMWINTSTLFVRYNSGVRLLEMRRSNPGQLIEDAHATDPDAIVDYWVNRLIQRPVADDKRDVLAKCLGDSPRAEDVRRMVQLIVSMPEYQLC
jgi:uncharacterized protein (DUF1800 family)